MEREPVEARFPRLVVTDSVVRTSHVEWRCSCHPGVICGNGS